MVQDEDEGAEQALLRRQAFDRRKAFQRQQRPPPLPRTPSR